MMYVSISNFTMFVHFLPGLFSCKYKVYSFSGPILKKNRFFSLKFKKWFVILQEIIYNILVYNVLINEVDYM